ncbi:leucine aminopeptidase 3, chloroplastic-like [Vigna umbellata]|uniref:leucine aminopeptidase 3, chloroplastic-like n=1 Tax=Vigna umbellata TaxID=87088 RepID=UPI001F5E7B68|nr:leucine aminopeptidase 3, chloroplastic-like [Vigna umbellata]
MASIVAASSAFSTILTAQFLIPSSSSSSFFLKTLTRRSTAPLLRLSLTSRRPLRNLMAYATLGLTRPSNTETPKISFASKEVDVVQWKGDLLAIGVTEKDLARNAEARFENAILNSVDSKLDGLLAEASTEEDFTGKPGQSIVLRIAGELGSKRVALLGLGASASTFAAFKSLGEAVASAANYSIKSLHRRQDSPPRTIDATVITRSNDASSEFLSFFRRHRRRLYQDPIPRPAPIAATTGSASSTTVTLASPQGFSPVSH